METLLEKLQQDLANGELSEETKAEAAKVISEIIKTDRLCTWKRSDAIEHAKKVFEYNWKEIADYSEKRFENWMLTSCRSACNMCRTIWARDYTMPLIVRGLPDTWGD